MRWQALAEIKIELEDSVERRNQGSSHFQHATVNTPSFSPKRLPDGRSLARRKFRYRMIGSW